jgi:prepilin peptidase CpaA
VKIRPLVGRFFAAQAIEFPFPHHGEFSFQRGCGEQFRAQSRKPGCMNHELIWLLAIFIAVWAGVLDWRYHRIPNWLTVTGFAAGLAMNSWLGGWHGAKTSLLGTLLGLGLIFPFYLLRAMGGGDWKLVGAMGGILGPGALWDVLLIAVLVAGIMAVIMIVARGRAGETLRNMGNMLASLARMQMPGAEVSLDNPNSARIPFGVSVAVAVALFGGRALWMMFGRAS